MDPETLVRSTFEDMTFFEVRCLPGIRMYLDAPDVQEDLSDLPEFVEALRNFMELTPEDLKVAEPHLFAEFKQCEAAIDPTCLDVVISDSSEVWGELEFRSVNLMKPDDKVYVQLAAECSWDPEHGIQLIFRNGKHLTRVSEQDGHYDECDPWALPIDEDHIQ